MLGKLFKHEWKATWKIPTGLIVLLLVATLFAGSTFTLPIWESDLEGMEMLVMLVWMLYYFVIIGVSVGIVIFLAVRFYKSMYTDEGYLTHTLPVTSHELLISKILPMIIWYALEIVAICISIFIFYAMAINYLETDMQVMELVEEIISIIDEDVILFLISILFLCVSGLLSGSMMVVGSITIGQLVRKHKMLGSIGTYVVMTFAVQILTAVFMAATGYYLDSVYMDNVLDFMTPIYFCMGVGAIIISVALYFISEFIIRRKLNLD